MQLWHLFLISAFNLFSLVGVVRAYMECRVKKNAYGWTPVYYLIGAFVWGDVLVFGVFWGLVSIVVILLQDWILFWLIVSVFWVVRSHGEAIYWFNQQFSTVKRQPPEKLPLYNWFHNDSIWFVYQILMQCITVISIITSIYFGTLWVKGLG